MSKLVPVLVLTAVAGAAIPVPGVAAGRLTASLSAPSADTAFPQAVLVLVGGMSGGGMGGMHGGGMGGMNGGGMGGMSGGGMGGMSGGGMGGMSGGGMSGGVTPAYSGSAGFADPSAGSPQSKRTSYASGQERPQYYHCIAQHGQCSVTSSLGPLRRGASCTCLFGGRGTIR